MLTLFAHLPLRPPLFFVFIFSKVLEDDTDLAMMNLTRMYQNPEDYVQPLCVEVLEDHEEMELLLEAYLQVGDIRSSSPLFRLSRFASWFQHFRELRFFSVFRAWMNLCFLVT